jgi:hypothetical protein
VGLALQSVKSKHKVTNSNIIEVVKAHEKSLNSSVNQSQLEPIKQAMVADSSTDVQLIRQLNNSPTLPAREKKKPTKQIN